MVSRHFCTSLEVVQLSAIELEPHTARYSYVACAGEFCQGTGARILQEVSENTYNGQALCTCEV